MKTKFNLLAIIMLFGAFAFTACSNSASGVSSAIDENRSGIALVTASEGGTVTYNNEITLSVPAEAVAEDTTITIKRLSECPQKFDEGYTPFGQIYKFTPDGTVFNLDKPAIMELNYNETALLAAGLDPKTVSLFYYDEENGWYVAVEGNVEINRKQITARVEHFTIYILMAKALLPGNNPPQVLLQNPIPNPIRAGVPIYIRATIRDNDADGIIASARLYYRKLKPVADSWQSISMKKEARPNALDTYAAAIPASYLTSSNLGTGNDLEIYVVAHDNLGAITQTTTRGYNITRTYNAGSITITPATQTISAGFDSLFTVKGRDSSSANFQFIPESFSVSNGLGTVKNWGSQGVYFKAQSKGTETLTVSDGINSATASLTIKSGDIASISILDTNGLPISGNLTLTPGSSYEFDVVGKDEFSNTIPVNPVWSVDSAIGTIDNNGKLTVTTITGATGNVTATLGDHTATQQIKVKSTLKNMLTFSIGGYSGTISAPFITLTDNGTSNLNGLVATFTTNGARVEVGGVVQTSGTTSNDFRTPIVYTVFAEDGSSQDYTVTVLIGVTGVTLNQSSIVVNTGKTTQLTATISPANASNMAVNWSTSDSAIASVDNTGKVTGIMPGTVSITVTTVDGSRTANCQVTVEDIKVTGVSLDFTDVTIQPTSTKQLTATITPSDATNKSITWSSSNTSIATVDSTGLVAGVAIGTATITVTTLDGGKTTSCIVVISTDLFATATTPGDSVAVIAGTAVFDMIYANNSASITFPTGEGDFQTTTLINDKFFIGKTEVTYELWKIVYDWATTRGANVYTFANAGIKGNDGAVGKSTQHPVTTINWRDAIVWCNALTEYYNDKNGTALECVYTYSSAVIRDSRDVNAAVCEGAVASTSAKGFRLPTGMEWEYAARYRIDSTNTVAGYSNPYFTKGNSASGAILDYTNNAATSAVGVYGYYSYGIATGVISTAEVMSKGSAGANSLGLYDMSGNVFEWCFDLSGGNNYRWCRGGAWTHEARYLQVGHRGEGMPEVEYAQVGFRISKTQ